MTTEMLSFVGVPDTLSYPTPTGFTARTSNGARILSGALLGLSGNNTFWTSDTVIPVSTFSAAVKVKTVNYTSRGVGFCTNTGAGLMFIARDTDIRIFALVNGELSGGAIGAPYTITLAENDIISVDVSLTSLGGTYVTKQNGITRGTFTNSTYTSTSGLFAGFVLRSSQITEFSLSYISPYTIESLTNPLVTGAAFSGTASGFTAGAATLTGGGLSIPVTIAGGADPKAFSGTLTALADSISYPIVPAAGVTWTLTQGTSIASISRDLDLPETWQSVKWYSSTITGLSSNPTSLIPAFDAIGLPLNVGDAIIYERVNGLTITSSGDVIFTSSPINTTVYVRRASDGKVYAHAVTLSG